MKINKYTDINDVANETKKDLIDRHSPFISVFRKEDNKGEAVNNEYKIEVTVGNEYTHPDDLDHYISTVSIYAGTTKVAEANMYAGLLGGQGQKGQTKVSFDAVFTKPTKITAHAYCTKHGLWESDPLPIPFAE